MKELDEAVRQYLSRIASKGGKARAEKYDSATLRKWGKKGGRPPKNAKESK
jgi:general stress protein YciG